MNRILRVLVFLLLVYSFAFSQSLGDIARQNRQVKRTPAKHVYTDDDIPSKTSEVKQATTKSEEDAKPADKGKEETKDSSADAGKPDAQQETTESEEAQQKKWEQYKTRIADQKNKIDLLQRELEVAKRQNEIQVTEYYNDAGSRLRNPEYFSQQMKKYQDTVDTKTKAIQEANSALDNMRDEGRKAGVPSSYLD